MPDLMLHVLVVDDEPPARRKLENWLAAIPDVRLVAACGNGFEALAVLARETIDLLFLDVQMPEMDGFALLEQMPPGKTPLVIFVTAYDQYAIEAFKQHALDYLLKPYDRDRFALALSRARAQHQQRQQQTLNAQLTALLQTIRQKQSYLARFVVKTRQTVRFVAVEEVDWIGAEGNYACLHTPTGQHLIRATLTSLEAQLDPQRFARIHRTAIVNLNRIQSLHPISHGDFRVLLVGGTALTLSRTYRERLRERLALHI